MTVRARHSGLGTRLSILAAALAPWSAQVGAQAAAPSTDVYLYRLAPARSEVVNITNRVGYDNQPAWVGNALFFTVQSNGQTDIHRFNFETGTKAPVVETPESEYSAAPTPDGKGYAVIRVELDSTQRMWRFPMGAGAPSVILPLIKPVGYFAYLDSTTLALFVLGNPRIPRDPSTLQIADIRTGKGTVVAANIGRSLQHVPGGRRASFTQRSNGKTILETVDPTPRANGSYAIDTVATLPDSADYVVWRNATTLITGAGSRLMQLQLPSGEWTVLADLSAKGIHGISRLALSPRGDQIAFVADEPRSP